MEHNVGKYLGDLRAKKTFSNKISKPQIIKQNTDNFESVNIKPFCSKTPCTHYTEGIIGKIFKMSRPH